jgi:hypothetical protein
MGLGIIGMALSNQSELPESQFKQCIHPNPRLPEDDLQRLA